MNKKYNALTSIFVFLLTLAMTVVLASCSSLPSDDEEDSSSSSDSSTTTTTTTTTTTAPITATVYGVFGETLTLTTSITCSGTLTTTMSSSGTNQSVCTSAQVGTSFNVNGSVPNNTCRVFKGSGTVASLGNNVVITCWNNADLSSAVSNVTSTNAGDPQVALSDNNDGVIAWQQYDDTNKRQIFRSYYDFVGATSTWETISSISSDHISPDGQEALYPTVAMDASGDAIIAWRQYNGSNNQIYLSERRSDTWSNPADLTDSFSPLGSNADKPCVSLNNTMSVVAWRQYDTSGKLQIFRHVYSAGAWDALVSTPDDNISPDGSNATSEYSCSIGLSGGGQALIVWNQWDNNNRLQVLKSEYRSGGWDDPINSLSFSQDISLIENDAYSPRVAMDDNDNAMIIWTQSEGGVQQLFVKREEGGLWETNPQNLSQNISPDEQGVSNPKIVMKSANAVIVWEQSDGSKSQIFKSEYRDGSWTHPGSLTDNISPDGQNAYDPQVAMNDDGDTIIVWRQYDGANWQIYMSEYRNGVWEHPADLTDHISPAGTNASSPKIAIDNKGNAAVVWQQANTSAVDLIYKSEVRSNIP